MTSEEDTTVGHAGEISRQQEEEWFEDSGLKEVWGLKPPANKVPPRIGRLVYGGDSVGWIDATEMGDNCNRRMI